MHILRNLALSGVSIKIFYLFAFTLFLMGPSKDLASSLQTNLDEKRIHRKLVPEDIYFLLEFVNLFIRRLTAQYSKEYVKFK